MEYKIVTLDELKLSAKSFKFPTSELQTADYSSYYQEVCSGVHPQASYGVYQITDEETTFTVAIDIEGESKLDDFTIRGGKFYQFELDLMKNSEANEYVKCYEVLEKDNAPYVMEYGVEVMDRTFNPAQGQFKFKYYVPVK